MPPRRALLACLLLVACGHGAQPGAPDATSDDAPGDGNEPDHEPPRIVAMEPAGDVWLREPIRFVFDEPIDAADATVSATLDGAPIGATLALAGDRTIAVTFDPAAVGVGTAHIMLGGTIRDLAHNAAALPIDAVLTVPAWSRPPVDRGVAAEPPAIAIGDDASVYAAWTVGSPRHVVVSRYVDGAWRELGNKLGSGGATSASIAIDAAGRPLVAWIDAGTARVARWDAGAWSALPSPGTGDHVALGAGGRVAVAGSVIAVRALAQNDTWQVVGDFALGGTPVGAPAVAGTAVAWIAGSGGSTQIRIARDGALLSPIAAAGAQHVSLAARGSTLAIAWDEHGGSMNVVAAVWTGTAWSRLGRPLDVDAAGDATAPAIALDSSGHPVVAWRERIETAERGVIARWSGSAWTIVGGPAWHAAGGAPTRPALAVHADAPVVASVAGGALEITRFNGPATAGPGMVRKSIAGCGLNAANPSPTLYATGCFSAGTLPVAHAGLVPYDIVNELWSDGTKKRRWIGLPDGGTLMQAANGSWSAPVGTIIVKEFAIETTPGDPATRRPVETRFLAHTSAGWRGFTYRWRANGSDADLLNDGQYTYDWPLDTGGTYRHLYPSRSQCLSCHHGSQGPLLGLRGAQLARWYDYGGTIADQGATLAAIGVGPAIGGAPYVSVHDRGASWDQRTRAYMAANCAHCHNPNNIAIKDLRYTTPLAQTRLCEVIVPGSPSQSEVYTRVTSRPGMPPLGTLVADPLPEQLLSRWISGMTSCP